MNTSSKRRSFHSALMAISLCLACVLPFTALAQHAGGAHGGGGGSGGVHGGATYHYSGHAYYGGGYYAHGYYGHPYYGYHYYGHPYYGYGYYGAWGYWGYPWAYGVYAPYYYGAPYYYNNTYVVTPAPTADSAAAEGTGGAPPAGDELFAYPMKNQTEAQQSQDRYECHRWAADQTGFDVTQANGNVPAEQAATKRGEYLRAEMACLAGRGYSVK